MAPPSHRGRKRKPVSHYTDDNPSTFTTKEKHERHESAASSRSEEKSPSRRAKRQLPPPEPSSNDKDTPTEMGIHDHEMRLHPILPVPQEDSAQHDVIFGKGFGPPAPLPKPEWQLVSTPHMVQDDSQKKKKKKRSIPPRIMCMSISGDYMACGNSLGEILLYALQPLVIHIATIATTASQRPLDATFKRKSEANAIHCIAIHETTIVIATVHEVECYNAMNHSLEWTFALTEGQDVTKLDVSPTTEDVLCSVVNAATPLWLMQYRNNALQVKQDVLPTSILRCAAMWDKSSLENQMLVVTTSRQDDHPQELFLMKKDSAVLHKAVLPSVRASKAMERISQSAQGMYTCVASSKGIRLYNTATLELVHVYGEGLTLHGHGVVYQQALLISEKPEEEYGNGVGVYVLGVPHARLEPRELQESLQVWQWWDNVHPSYTLAGPPRSLGMISVWSSTGSTILACTHAGDVWMLSPTATTDWPGVMYPPGYHTISDNLIYIEDEDELDQVVETVEEEDSQLETLDDELAEALRQSMLEQSAVPKEEDVTIVDETTEECIVIPCHPDPALKEAIQQNDILSSPKRSGGNDELTAACFLRQVLETLPTRTLKTVISSKEQPKVKVLEATTNVHVKAVRGKRSRTGNLEALIRASIDPELQKFMTSKEKWADGSGSTLRDVDKVPLKVVEERTVPKQAGTFVKEQEVVAIGSAAAIANSGTIEPPQGEVDRSRLHVFTKEESDTINGGSAPAAANSEAARGFSVEEERKETIRQVVASRPIDDAATSALEGMLALQRSFSEDASPRKIVALPTSTMPPVPQFDGQSTLGAIPTVVMNSPTGNVKSDGGADVVVTQIIQGAEQRVSANGESVQAGSQQANVNSVSSSPTSHVTVAETMAETEKTLVTQSENNSRGTDMTDIGANQDSQAGETEVPAPEFCGACRGRMVIHTCGKRETPIDVESIARAEKEKLERDAEEKKKLRAEKRRKADARRREAKRKKKLEEEEQRRAEEERRRIEEEEVERSRQQVEERFPGDHAERDRRRAEMWQRLMAANGGGSQEDTYGAQTSQLAQIRPPASQSAYALPLQEEVHVQQHPSQAQGFQQSQASYVGQQQPHYRVSYDRPAMVQNSYISQQEHAFVSTQAGHIRMSPLQHVVPAQATYSRASPMLQAAVAQPFYSRTSPLQQATAQPAIYPMPNEQLDSSQVQATHETLIPRSQETVDGQQQYPGAFQQQNSAATSPYTVTSTTPATAPDTDIAQQQQHHSSYEQSLSQAENSRAALLETRTSIQLGTAEALASLASMCVQMPRAPTPQTSPHGSNMNGTSVITNDDSNIQPTSVAARESSNTTAAIPRVESTTQTELGALDISANDQSAPETQTELDAANYAANVQDVPMQESTNQSGNAGATDVSVPAKVTPLGIWPGAEHRAESPGMGNDLQQAVVDSASSTANGVSAGELAHANAESTQTLTGENESNQNRPQQ